MDKDKKRFSIRIDLRREKDAIAWDLLNEVPCGERSAFVIDAILEKSNRHPLQSTLMYIKESIENKIDALSKTIETNGVQITSESIQTNTSKEPIISNEVLDFMKSL